ARVLADQDRGVRVLFKQYFPRRVTQPQHEVRRHRALSDRAAHAVSPEMLSHVAFPRMASQTAITSRVSLMSCTRSIVAPPCNASKAIARLPARRSSTGRPVSLPSVDLRERPA